MNRRAFLRSSIAAASAAIAEVKLSSFSPLAWAAAPETEVATAFPKDFMFGAATSCVQIEGASREDGKGDSTWDRFSRLPGTIHDGSTPDPACDSYHRWPEDVALLKRMNLQSYRFSIAWPRILPAGRGAVNQKGLDHYSRLIDALLADNISPLVTCFHWDLPAALEDMGGWTNREVASYFADYCGLLAKTYGDRAQRWCVLNEPQAFTVVGYGWGSFPPGKKDQGLMLRATHTANLALGQAFRAMKAHNSQLQLGFAHDFDLGTPASESDADHAAWKRYDAFRNRWFLDPSFTGQYPEAFEGGVPAERMGLKPGDENILKVPLDYSGVNFYCERQKVAAGESHPLLHGLNSHEVKGKHELDPSAMYDAVMRFAREYKRPIEITETGFVSNDVPDARGRVRDTQRIAFMREMLTSLRRAMTDGANVRAVHIWSLLDDWEWSSGLEERIGLTYVDFKDKQKRILKDSGRWYGAVARTRSIGATVS